MYVKKDYYTIFIQFVHYYFSKNLKKNNYIDNKLSANKPQLGGK